MEKEGGKELAKKDNGANEVLKNAAERLLDRLSGKASLEDIQKLVRTESSQEIKQIVKGTGLIAANMQMKKTESLGRTPDSLRRTIAATFERMKKMARNQDSGNALEVMKNDFIDALNDGAIAQRDVFAQVRFASSSGTIIYCTMQLMRMKISEMADWGYTDERYNWYSGMIEGAFTPAPDYRIESHSKSNFFSSRQKIVVVPLQTTIDNQKIAAILDTVPTAVFDFYHSHQQLGANQDLARIEN
eukprot:CAMPEP_0174275974 /NCGR_PEP_ID=MMETSP0439-20130205/60130_1 /TAXON_ID=0 /ORGANISM="Stereomyxa ramosa, Strain Chinc5" /LENGTH=244 /DNA_ID=CAMNT_0015368155 /DNA_START=595 /DNA_END=1329 /DNA_ORIENTATION=-